MVNEAKMALAIIECNSLESPNYEKIAFKYELIPSTLRRRHKGKTTSNAEAHSTYLKLLTNLQEELLIEHIEKLADRGILFNPQIIENLAVGLAKREVGGRWVERFTKRHDDKLKSIYMRNIDHARKVADNSRHFKHYFNLVRPQGD